MNPCVHYRSAPNATSPSSAAAPPASPPRLPSARNGADTMLRRALWRARRPRDRRPDHPAADDGRRRGTSGDRRALPGIHRSPRARGAAVQPTASQWGSRGSGTRRALQPLGSGLGAQPGRGALRGRVRSRGVPLHRERHGARRPARACCCTRGARGRSWTAIASQPSRSSRSRGARRSRPRSSSTPPATATCSLRPVSRSMQSRSIRGCGSGWAGVKDTDAAVRAARHGVFKTPPGEGRILAPWGSSGRIDRQISALDVADLSHAEIECRRMVMEEADRLRREVPGFEAAFVTDIASQLGITESRRMTGARTLTREEANTPQADVDRAHRQLDQGRHAVRHPVRLSVSARSLQSARRRTLHLGRSPRASLHQGDPGMLRHRRSRRDRRGDVGSLRRRRRAHST